MTVTHDTLTIEWLGYATLRIATDDTVVYLDPGRYGVLTGEWTPDSEPHRHPPAREYAPHDADLVAVTHDDHYDSDGIERVSNEETTLVLFESISPRFIDREDRRIHDLPGEVVRVGEHDDRAVGDVILRTVPAYNEVNGPHTRDDGEPFHPEGTGVGFHLTVDDTRLFWPGDTDVLDGHAQLDVDVFCPPIGGAFTMDRHEAAGLAADLTPERVVPVHYDTFDALETDVEAFAAELAEEEIPVTIDDE